MYMTPPLSPIQNSILSTLKNAKSLRYSELAPDTVPNDLFNYHLQFLVKKELLEKTGDGYSLSTKGIKYVADPYVSPDSSASFFKLNVITIVSRKVGGTLEILNQLRTSNPSYGKVGVMGGVVLKGESTADAATRKLKQETGLDAEFRVVGMERRMLYKSGKLFSDTLFPICYTDTYTGALLPVTSFGEHKWVSLVQAIKNESAPFDSLSGIATVLRSLENGTLNTLPFFFTESVQDDTFCV